MFWLARHWIHFSSNLLPQKLWLILIRIIRSFCLDTNYSQHLPVLVAYPLTILSCWYLSFLMNLDEKIKCAILI